MTGRDEVRELRATIEAITGIEPRSHDLDYLRRRVVQAASTKAREHDRNGNVGVAQMIRQRASRRIDLRLDEARAIILNRLAFAANVENVAVIVKALDEYAVRLGFGVAVERAKKGIRR